jgi:hypothetical protein
MSMTISEENSHVGSEEPEQSDLSFVGHVYCNSIEFDGGVLMLGEGQLDLTGSTFRPDGEMLCSCDDSDTGGLIMRGIRWFRERLSIWGSLLRLLLRIKFRTVQPIRQSCNAVDFPAETSSTIEMDGTLVLASPSTFWDLNSSHDILWACPCGAHDVSLEAAGTIVIDPVISSECDIAISDTIINADEDTYVGGTVIYEDELRLAVWQGCYGAETVWIDFDQEEAAIRQTVRRKHRKCRYGFLRPSLREKRNRIWRRLFPRNDYRSHI